MDEILTIDPEPRSHIPGATNCVRRNALFKLISIILSNIASSDVADDGSRLRTDLARRLFERVRLATADDDARAFAYERLGDGSADAAARAGDQGDLVF